MPPEPFLDFSDTAQAYQFKTTAELRVAYAILSTLQYPRFTQYGARMAQAAMNTHVPGVAWLLEKTIFGLFFGGTTLESTKGIIDMLHQTGATAMLDYAVEGEKTEVGFDAARDQLIRTLVYGASVPGVSTCAIKLTALMPTPLLAKQQAGDVLSNEERAAYQRGQKRLEEIAYTAERLGVPIMVDAEESWIQGSIDTMVESLMAQFNRQRVVIFTTVQMYRHDREAYLHALIHRAQQGGFRLGIKLVRGAYIEKETMQAQALGVPNPLYPDKPSTDAAYDRAMMACLDHLDWVELCAATHNADSVHKLVDAMAQRGLSHADPRICFAQLMGMFDCMTYPLAAQGYRVSKYVPYGAVQKVIPYLLRRAKENQSLQRQSTSELAMIHQELRRRRELGGANTSLPSAPNPKKMG